ncbi:MAG: NTP transferase domain-containing protein [Deltaproteobacteria bacterium]|nr:NTP transferase domain-containing protein [Deltaproteobacteria bacterium]
MARSSDTPEGRLANVSAALLLGGASSRMGRDKSRVRVGGLPLATHTARMLEDLFEEVLLVGGEPPEDAPGRRVEDPAGPRCALRGLVAALAAAREERVLLVATDMPLLTPDLLLALTAWPEHDAVMPRDAAGQHPLCAIYRREPVLAAARERLAAGELSLGALADGLDCGFVEGPDLEALDPRGQVLSNVNTPDDLARVESLLA